MRTLALLAALAGLSGCATMTDQQCRTANWVEIGQRDGAAGWAASRLQEHAKACGEYGIVPNAGAYERGRQQGLLSYCQPTVGRSKGVEGATYYNVCSGPAETGFLRGYEVGRQIHGLKKLQDENRKRRKELTDQLAKKETSADEAKRIKRDLERLDQDDRRLQRLVEQAYQIPL
jgi:hypothetical protein